MRRRKRRWQKNLFWRDNIIGWAKREKEEGRRRRDEREGG